MKIYLMKILDVQIKTELSINGDEIIDLSHY